MRNLTAFSIVALFLTLATTSVVRGDDEVDRRWLDRLDSEDRAALDAVIGHAPATMPEDLRWLTGETKSWDDLRGKVVFIQSWTSKSSAGRSAPIRALRTAQSVEGGGEIVVLALHTPEGADTAERFLERRKLEMPVALDASGAFCDGLGIYKRPVNLLVDRHGTVRYAGLNKRGLESALAKLLAETFDPDTAAPERAPEPEPAVEFPKIVPGVKLSANDVRGRRAPEFFVQEWVTSRPDPAGKVVVIDFWATWCGPCVAMIPHMNEIADRFRDEVTVVGVSSEPNGKFRQGMDKLASSKGLTLDSFHYAIALDASKKMHGGIGVRGIPHVLVMSPDWIVRWQGHPKDLTNEVMRQIVDASKSGGGAGRVVGRWKKR